MTSFAAGAANYDWAVVNVSPAVADGAVEFAGVADGSADWVAVVRLAAERLRRLVFGSVGLARL